MYLISTQDFNRSTAIPNVNESNSGTNEQVDAYIISCVPNLLRLVLGDALFEDLDSQITNGALNNDADQKWKNLVNGVTYTKDGKDYVWKGLLYDNGLFKESVLTYFVFHQWYSDNITTMTGGGDAQLQVNNVNLINPNPHLAKVWNQFLAIYQGGQGFNNKNVSVVNGVVFVDYFNSNNSQISLIRFLQDNPTDYPDANLYIFESTANSNRFSI